MDDLIYNIRSYVSSVFPITIIDIIDIGVLAFLIYWGIKFVRETRAGGLIRGIVILAAAYIIASFFDMKAITFIMNNLFNAGIFAVLILFQPELRRTLEKMGHSKLSKIAVFQNLSEKEDNTGVWANAIEAVVDACEDLSATTTGALIVFEQESKLGEQIATGTVINAAPSKQLLSSIFFPNTPLHDGAVIMRDGMVLAAGCFLPMPQKEESINKSLGSRHRAAIGMSENSDAIIIVVSEETGTISVAENGELKRGFTRDSLKKHLRGTLIPERMNVKPAKKAKGGQT
ncbi:MAG: diadenylate cyclase CdaA [Ruminococcus sp.]|jgi:diadenylate cyclase|nr:diadenylate cyclase CdaA [Ruminococcus sp.]